MEGKMDAVAVLFGDFQITNKNIQNEMLNIINILKDYEVFRKKKQNFMINESVIKPVIEIFSKKKGINIRISDKKIDIINPIQIDEQGNRVEYNELDFIKMVKDIQKKLLNYYNINGNRISYVVNFCKSNEQKIEEIKNKVISKYFYKADKTFEWSVKSAVKEEFFINNNKEEINVITNLNYNPRKIKIAIGKNAIEIYGLMYKIDINTSPSNKQTRIDDKFIDEFYEQAVNLFKNIEEEY